MTHPLTQVVLTCCSLLTAHRSLLTDPSRAATATNRSTHLARDEFGSSKHPQEILAQDFPNVLFTVATLQ
jgi:hypothetical protein